MRRLTLVLIAALVLAVCAPALADVRRGDRGEEVRYLQWLLFENGWLFEEPDGVFGGHTEQAVKDYQRAKGLEATGEADYALMQMIDRDRVALDREHFGADYYMAYDGDFVPPFPTVPETERQAAYVPPAHCQTIVLRDVAWRDSCERHYALEQQAAALTEDGDAAGFAEAGDLWLKEAEALFNASVAEAPAAQKLDWLNAWTAWNAAFGEQRGAIYLTWPDDPGLVERELMLMLRYFAGALCEIRSGELPADADMGYIEPMDGQVFNDFCELWQENPGTEFLTPCHEHACLTEREYEITYGGADDRALEDLASDWDMALFALYDEWLALLDEESGDAVRSARSNFFLAQTALSIALEPYGIDNIARIRVDQMECGRLCELLRYIQQAN